MIRRARFVVWLAVTVGGIVAALATQSAWWLLVLLGGWIVVALSLGPRRFLKRQRAGMHWWWRADTFENAQLDDLMDDTRL